MVRVLARSVSAPATTDFPAKAPWDEQVRFLLSFAVQAPSTRNTQPWKFVLHDRRIHVEADPTRRLPVADPEGREALLSIGAAMLNLRVAAARHLVDCDVRYDPEPGDHAAVVRIRDPGHPMPDLARLYPAIHARRTNRSEYSPWALSPIEERDIRHPPPSYGRNIRIVEDTFRIAEVAELVNEADHRQMSNPAWRAELARWIRPHWRGDGLPASSLGLPGLVEWAGAPIVRMMDLGDRAGTRDRSVLEGAPTIAVVSAPDRRLSILRAGEAMQGFLLAATRAGLDCAFHSSAIQDPELREKLRVELGLHDPPQVLLRVGHASEPAEATPRRALDDVVLYEI